MADPLDERLTDEIEALQAILLDDVVVKTEGDVPQVVETVVHPSTGEDVDQQFVCVTLEVILTPRYPDSSPQVTLRNPRGLSDAFLEMIYSQIANKLNNCLGQPVIFEVIELVRDNLTQSNMPNGKCVICLLEFLPGDVFIKSQCYHHFHSLCLGTHLMMDRKIYKELCDSMPVWQQMMQPPYRQSCPVCRCKMTFDVDVLQLAPPPLESLTMQPFVVTPDLKTMQGKFLKIMDYQKSKGGLIGMGDDELPTLTLTSPSEAENAAQEPQPGPSCSNALPSTSQDRRGEAGNDSNGAPSAPNTASNSAPNSASNSAPNAAPNSAPTGNSNSRGVYRGFRRNTGHRRGRGGR